MTVVFHNVSEVSIRYSGIIFIHLKVASIWAGRVVSQPTNSAMFRRTSPSNNISTSRIGHRVQQHGIYGLYRRSKHLKLQPWRCLKAYQAALQRESSNVRLCLLPRANQSSHQISHVRYPLAALQSQGRNITQSAFPSHEHPMHDAHPLAITPSDDIFRRIKITRNIAVYDVHEGPLSVVCWVFRYVRRKARLRSTET
jgi:hypothetical protein